MPLLSRESGQVDERWDAMEIPDGVLSCTMLDRVLVLINKIDQLSIDVRTGSDTWATAP